MSERLAQGRCPAVRQPGVKPASRKSSALTTTLPYRSIMLLLNGGYNYDSTSIRPRYRHSTIYVTIIRLTMCAGCCSAAQINIYRLAWLLLADYVSVNLMTFDKQSNGRRIVLAIAFGLLLLCCRRSSLSIENEQSKIVSTSARLSVMFWRYAYTFSNFSSPDRGINMVVLLPKHSHKILSVRPSMGALNTWGRENVRF